MKREELTALIDRVIGSKGILRTPAYWMRRVLNKMSDYADESLESVKELIAVNAQETATLLDEKSDVYDLPDAGTYALDSTEGQKLLKALNNSKKMLLRRRIEGSTYIDFLTLEASIYNVQGDPQTLILSNLSNPKFVYVNNALTSVDFKRFLGYISLSDDSITVTYSDFLESSIPITNTIDNLESESTTAALSANQGRVLKEMIGQGGGTSGGGNANGVTFYGTWRDDDPIAAEKQAHNAESFRKVVEIFEQGGFPVVAVKDATELGAAEDMGIVGGYGGFSATYVFLIMPNSPLAEAIGMSGLLIQSGAFAEGATVLVNQDGSVTFA